MCLPKNFASNCNLQIDATHQDRGARHPHSSHVSFLYMSRIRTRLNSIAAEEGSSPLHIAVIDGDFDEVDQLIQAQPSLEATTRLINAQRKDGATALLLAAATQNFEVVKYLLRHFADPSIMAAGWRWDVPRSALASGGVLNSKDEPFSDCALRGVSAAGPLVVAVMTALKAENATPDVVHGDRSIRALVMCGGCCAELNCEEAEEELSEFTYKALEWEELIAYLGVEGVDGDDLDAQASQASIDLLGFDACSPLRLRASPWVRMSAEEKEAEAEAQVDDARESIEQDVQNRHGAGVDSRSAFVCQVVYQLATDPARTRRKHHESGLTDAMCTCQGGLAFTVMQRACALLLDDHTAKPLRALKDEALAIQRLVFAGVLWTLTPNCNSADVHTKLQQHLDGLRNNTPDSCEAYHRNFLAGARSAADVGDALRRWLLDYEARLVRLSRAGEFDHLFGLVRPPKRLKTGAASSSHAMTLRSSAPSSAPSDQLGEGLGRC